MSRLVIFGDSFAADRPEKNTWPKLLGIRYSIPVVYHSFEGSSIEYTATKFFEYLQSDYSETDKIVLVLTSGTRAPIVHDNYYPAWAPLFKFLSADPALLEKLNLPHFTQHLKEHSGYYETWIKFFNPKIHKSICHFMTKTLDALSNDKLILSAFEDSDSSSNASPANCHPTGNLMAISCGENMDGIVRQGYPGKDSRANHLSEENHLILENYIHECFQGNYKSLNEVNFKRRCHEWQNMS